MNRALQTFLISATVAVGAVVAVPATASAAPDDDKNGGGLSMTSPAHSSAVSPGEVYAGFVDASLAPEGEPVTLVAKPLLSGGPSVCDDGTQIGAGTVGPGGALEIRATGAVPDGLTLVYFCHPTFGAGNVYVMDNPFELRSPAAGEGLPVDRAVVTGVGSPGAQVDARTADGSTVGSAVVGQDGTWSVTLSGMAQGPTTFTFTQGSTSFDADFTILEAAEGSPLIDPMIGGALTSGALASVIGVLIVRRRRSLAAV
jgi:hypothetical protein